MRRMRSTIGVDLGQRLHRQRGHRAPARGEPLPCVAEPQILFVSCLLLHSSPLPFVACKRKECLIDDQAVN